MFGFHLVPQGASVLVKSVTPGLPAERAGVQPGDRILSFNGATFDWSNYAEMHDALDMFRPGDLVDLEIMRGDETVALAVEVGTATQEYATSMAERYERAQSSIERDKRSAAFKSFLELARREPLFIRYSKDETSTISWICDETLLPEHLDFLKPPAVDWVLAKALEMLRPGDVLTIEFSLRDGALAIRPIEEPPYLSYREIAMGPRPSPPG